MELRKTEEIQVQCAPLATEAGISLMLCQQQFLEKFGGRHPPSKSSIWAFVEENGNQGDIIGRAYRRSSKNECRVR
jgi:hypothetical protein